MTEWNSIEGRKVLSTGETVQIVLNVIFLYLIFNQGVKISKKQKTLEVEIYSLRDSTKKRSITGTLLFGEALPGEERNGSAPVYPYCA